MITKTIFYLYHPKSLDWWKENAWQGWQVIEERRQKDLNIKLAAFYLTHLGLNYWEEQRKLIIRYEKKIRIQIHHKQDRHISNDMEKGLKKKE